ncbi:hypothetical protein PPTG_04309 [Phytophthora nicotianae INRA-310]|uniref:Uncharacterized protein n=2 Tax=Phytophthora nicotianae TaxID=4792 RepID=W2R2X5_PHYN3|nr:hypothetical protein PPTG_04309 [Phytophthora nicotianae INRA-310]ETN18835.1 hypothetical protein PPTG_04309 [Phytophthora nicotianae INRA-310]
MRRARLFYQRAVLRGKSIRRGVLMAFLGLAVFSCWVPWFIMPIGSHFELEKKPASAVTSALSPDASTTSPLLSPSKPVTDTLHPDASVPSVLRATAPASSVVLRPNTPVASALSSDSPVTSVLHPDTPEQGRLNPLVPFTVKATTQLFSEYEETFPQHGKNEPGQHYRIENTEVLTQPGNRDKDSVLIICVLNDAQSWGKNRTMEDFFKLIGSFEYPRSKISIALLTSSMVEFTKAKQLFGSYIEQYSRLSVIFRNDFSAKGLTRANRHIHSLQASRRRMLARYRNYALLSTMESWHQHVLWVDADVTVIPPGLVLKMVKSGRDIVEPMCVRNIRGRWVNYDRNAWVGQRKVRSANDKDFVPGPLNARSFHNLPDRSKPFVPLDSVGGTMLYVRADIHRQGVMFPVHYVIGSEWGREGYDGIETEGLCYSAHFLGYKCWGMPQDAIQHVW